MSIYLFPHLVLSRRPQHSSVNHILLPIRNPSLCHHGCQINLIPSIPLMYHPLALRKSSSKLRNHVVALLLVHSNKFLISVLPIFSIIFNKCFYQLSIPNAWKISVTRLLRKPAATKDSHNLSNFRPITLTSCMGKVFTSILKRRVLSYMGTNNYLDTSIQKAFINNIPGCLEHQVKLSWAIQEANLNNNIASQFVG